MPIFQKIDGSLKKLSAISISTEKELQVLA